MVQYAIWDLDTGKWVDDTVGLGYDECILTGYKTIGKGKLPESSQYEMLKFLVENRFDLRQYRDEIRRFRRETIV